MILPPKTISFTREQFMEKFPVLGTFAEHMDLPWSYAPSEETAAALPSHGSSRVS